MRISRLSCLPIFGSLCFLLYLFSFRISDTPSNSPFLIYSAYFTYISGNTVAFQAVGFSKCRLQHDSLKLLTGKRSFPVRAFALQAECPNSRNCTWVDHKLYAELPATIDRTQTVLLTDGHTTVRVPISESLVQERTEGLEVCVSPLYYFNHWIRVIELIELYRQQKASHFYIYVSSVSKIVDDVLKLYDHKGLVTVVRWPELPTADGTTESVFRLGQNSAIQDCLFRSRGKFVAVIDLDDYIIVQNKSLLDFLERRTSDNPNLGSIAFEMVLAPQKPYSGDLSNWKSIDFSVLEEAEISLDHGNTKSVVMPDRVHIVSPHDAYLLRRRPGFRGSFGLFYQKETVSREIGMSYHTRTALYTDHNQKAVFEKRKFLSRTTVQTIKSNFDTIVQELAKDHMNLTTPETAQTMQDCNPSILGYCQTPYRTCRQVMSTVDQWVFPEDFEGFSLRYVML